MALNARQTALYNASCLVYRESASDRSALGDPGGVRLVLTVASCHHKTTSSFEQKKSAAGRLNQDNLQTSDQIHFDYGTDVRTGDVVKMTSGPSNGQWFMVAGSKHQKLRANYAAVYILPTDAPTILS